MRLGLWEYNPPTRKAENIICDYCGKEFYRSPANRKTKKQYCSQECMAKAFNGRFVGEKSPRWKGRKTELCFVCSKPVTRPLWAWRQNSMTFCDFKCFGKWKSDNWVGENNPCWRGGHEYYYGADWLKQSERVRKRDHYSCRFCGSKQEFARRAFDVHHIIPFRFFGIAQYKKANKLKNLITFCENCHRKAEHISKHGDISNARELLCLMRQKRYGIQMNIFDIVGGATL